MATNRSIVMHHDTDSGITGTAARLGFSRIDLNQGVALFHLHPADGSEGPEIPVPLSIIRPNTIEDADEVWQSLADTLFKQFRAQGRLPDFFRGYAIQTGEDSTGDPALYLRILVTPTQGPANDAKVGKWNDFAALVRESLLQLRLQRWPYVQLGEFRGKK